MAARMNEQLHYTGNRQPERGAVDADGRKLKPYLPSADLVEAVNLSIFLCRPLLLRGEPGCGKSLLASAVAFELGLQLETWSIRSTTRAVDGLYLYDAVARLQAAQLASVKGADGKPLLDAGSLDADRYVRLGPVGRAFAADRRYVLLIDEIDKADIDFPNDLLDIIEHPAFAIEETGGRVTAKHQPIIFITSNDEKELPDAFLRRCLFAYVPFPDTLRLREIIEAHFGDPSVPIADKVIERFIELRNRQERDEYGGVKKVSTSELIDWMQVLLRDAKNVPSELATGRRYPFRSVLVKRREDLEFADKPMTDSKPAS